MSYEGSYKGKSFGLEWVNCVQEPAADPEKFLAEPAPHVADHFQHCRFLVPFGRANGLSLIHILGSLPSLNSMKVNLETL